VWSLETALNLVRESPIVSSSIQSGLLPTHSKRQMTTSLSAVVICLVAIEATGD
jgi:hypothetical protein